MCILLTECVALFSGDREKDRQHREELEDEIRLLKDSEEEAQRLRSSLASSLAEADKLRESLQTVYGSMADETSPETAALKRQLEEAKTARDALQAELAEVSETLRTREETLQSKIGELEARCENLQMRRLAEDVTRSERQLMDDVASLKQQVSVFDSERDTLNSTIETLRTQLTAARGEVGTAASSASALTDEMNQTLQREIDALRVRLAEVESTHDTSARSLAVRTALLFYAIIADAQCRRPRRRRLRRWLRRTRAASARSRTR